MEIPHLSFVATESLLKQVFVHVALFTGNLLSISQTAWDRNRMSSAAAQTKVKLDINNDRLIAIAISIFKGLERIFLARLKTCLFTADDQFGFKEGRVRKLRYLHLKKVEYYKNRDSTACICF